MESPDSATTGSSPGADRQAGVVAADGTRALVVIPTYNERDNLPGILARLHGALPGIHVLVVDDSSPDGTGELADQLSAGDTDGRVPKAAGTSAPSATIIDLNNVPRSGAL